MLIAAVLCLCAAVATAGSGVLLLLRPAADPVRMVLRGVAPTQLAAATMLAAGGIAALSADPRTAVLVLVVCVIGAVCTFAAGCWQSAKVVARSEAATAGRAGAAEVCGGSCASCALSCH